MTIYVLFQNITAVQKAPSAGALPTGSQYVQPISQNNPNSPANAHAFTLKVTGVGNCSATVQCIGSNDGANWINYGNTFQATGTTADITPGIASAQGTFPYNYVSGYVTAISGTNAAASLIVSA